MTSLTSDLRFALRGLTRRPAYSALLVLTLAAGLGVNTVVANAVDALLFSQLRVANADRYGWVFVGSPGNPYGSASMPVFTAMGRAGAFTRVAAEGRLPLALTLAGHTDQIWALAVSADYFPILDATPRVGRTISGSDGTGSELPVVVSERFWRARLDADPEPTSRTLVLNGRNAAVVGVLPDSFQGPGGLYTPDIWIPIAARRTLGLSASLDEPASRWLTLIAEPQTGRSPAAIAAEVQALLTNDPSLGAGDDARVRYVPRADGHPETHGALATLSGVALGGVGLVLLVACFNVAGLVLARTAERQREFAVRAALGATRARLVRLLCLESLLVACTAGGLALVVAAWSASLLAAFSLPAPIPQRLPLVIGWRLVGFTLGLTLLATIVPVLAPAWRFGRRDLAAGFGSRGDAGVARAPVRRAFLVVQAGGATLFLVCAIFFIRSFVHAAFVDTGFDTTHTATLELDARAYGYSPDRAAALARDLVARVAQAPGVAEVSIADRIPFYVGFTDMRRLSVDGSDCRVSECPSSGAYAVAGSYFRTMQMPMRAGRTFDERAPADRDAVVVSETAARRFWPGRSPLGETFREGPDARLRTVVGVVADVTHRAIGEPPLPYFYAPMDDAAMGQGVTIVARGSDPAALVTDLRDALAALAPGVPAQAVGTMRDRLALPLWAPRTLAGFFGICGALAVLLAGIGLFGSVFYAVHRRVREFGVRLALGATPRDVRALVIGESLRLMVPGVLAGLVLAAVGLSLARAALVQISPLDPWLYAAAAVTQALVVILASWWPARRAGRSNPMDVLRAE